MRTTYLAIFAASPSTIVDLKKLLNEAIDPTEHSEMERVATEGLINPQSVDAIAFEKIFKEDGKQKAINFFEKKLEPIVSRFLEDRSDASDLPWNIFDVIISDDFFTQLNSDENLHFQGRIRDGFFPDQVVLLNGTWTDTDIEGVIKKHQHGFVFVFFDIDY